MENHTMKYNEEGEEIGLYEWTDLFEGGRFHLKSKIGDFFVSTVFLGIDYNFGVGPPAIFETMVFHDDYSDLPCERYSTKQEATDGHTAMCQRVHKGEFDEVQPE
jgi:hypothetical protein